MSSQIMSKLYNDELDIVYKIFDERDFWKELFYSLPIPVLILDNSKKIVLVNNSIQNILNCDKNDIIGKHCYEIFNMALCKTCTDEDFCFDKCFFNPQILPLNGILKNKEYIVMSVPFRDADKFESNTILVLMPVFDKDK